MQSTMNVVVIGNGMVGHHFVNELISQDSNISIQVFCGEPRPAYDRVHLSEFFAGKSADDLALTTTEFYQENKIDFHVDTKITQIDRERKTVTTHTGQSFPYDKLILATGSYPFVPPIPGNDGEHCLVYRTIEDLEAIQASAAVSQVGVVIGGGLLGLEAANALKQLGLETHVIEFAPQLMAVQVDVRGGNILKNKIEQLDVQVHTATATEKIAPGSKHRYCLHFSDGNTLDTDLILFSAGIRPQDTLARSAELSIGERGGIIINDHCQTSDPDIYAIGECALWNERIFGLVAPGYTMARTAVSHLCAGDLTFTGADMSTKLKLLGVDVASIGDAHEKTAGAQSYTYEDQPNQIYKKIVIDQSGKKLLGAVLIGDNSAYDTLLQFFRNGTDLPETPEVLMLPDQQDLAALDMGDLPDAANICSCYNVAKADVITAMDNGCEDLASVIEQTKASTGCGGCAALLKSVVEKELDQRGIFVKKDICEHFPYSRQELFHLIQVEQIKSFDTLLSQFGKGLGCDICKPTVASILASNWNDYILKEEHVSLQDTNDNFLANIQKDGSYSVVPRVQGGEITADKLLAIGEVAKEFNLYCKITGGQRIDLFGARLEQLPEIWRQLIAAGFETGHAYGKSVRTVKSCVGSTWCRYGVQDCTTLAIDIENRYKGIRAPHKIKMAVSGCTRECAEAQSKDVGIIATEKGWNLYVCGNGGMKPRHADLFATDLDTQTLIRTIDRFLMFYIRTADRLQRTSVWLENLEGGLDYVKSVILEDSLDLGESLEQQMQQLIDAYACEWTQTVNDEQSLKRFRQFVNSPQSDEQIVFVEERGQIRPANPNEKDIIKAVNL